MIDKLLEAGVLTTTSQDAKPATPASVEPVQMRPMRPDESKGMQIKLRDIVHFAYACLSTSLNLRFRSFESIVKSLERRRARSQAGDQQVERMLELSRAFARMRTFAFTAHEHCLFHAVALAKFLARYRLTPTWVIGVQTDPFSAHCWVQCRSTVLDDRPEEVCLYTPILAI